MYLYFLYFRHFGGIKLGTGGLVRAYGGVAAECLRTAPTCLVKSKVNILFWVLHDLNSFRLTLKTCIASAYSILDHH